MGAMMNIDYLVFGIGYGLMVVGRSRINYLLGASKRTVAKKLTVVVIFIGVVLALGGRD